MERITVNNLRRLAEAINRETGSPQESYTRTESGEFRSNVGHYYIDCAYGGYALERMVNTAGGVTSVFGCGHVPARELYGRMHAYLQGRRDATQVAP